MLEYVAVKSAWRALTPLRVLFFWLIIPLIVIIVRAVQLKHEKIEFYSGYIVQKRGVLAKHERKSMFTGVISVSVDQSVGGRIFGYGDVRVDVVGKWDINTAGVKNPDGLKNYLESKIVQQQNVNTVMYA